MKIIQIIIYLRLLTFWMRNLPALKAFIMKTLMLRKEVLANIHLIIWKEGGHPTMRIARRGSIFLIVLMRLKKAEHIADVLMRTFILITALLTLQTRLFQKLMA